MPRVGAVSPTLGAGVTEVGAGVTEVGAVVSVTRVVSVRLVVSNSHVRRRYCKREMESPPLPAWLIQGVTSRLALR